MLVPASATDSHHPRQSLRAQNSNGPRVHLGEEKLRNHNTAKSRPLSGICTAGSVLGLALTHQESLVREVDLPPLEKADFARAHAPIQSDHYHGIQAARTALDARLQ